MATVVSDKRDFKTKIVLKETITKKSIHLKTATINTYAPNQGLKIHEIKTDHTEERKSSTITVEDFNALLLIIEYLIRRRRSEKEDFYNLCS